MTASINDFAISADHNASEFLAGQIACDDGEPCPEDATPSFVAGYSTEYQAQEMRAHGYRGSFKGVQV